MNKTHRFDTETPVDSTTFCGCSGISSDGGFAWNVLLPPHAGTGTIVRIIGDIFKSCVHEHTFQYLHEIDVESFKYEKCKGISFRKKKESSALKTRCSALEKHEFTVALVRNPYLRVLTGASYHGILNMSQPRHEIVSSFRNWFNKGAYHYVAPLTAMLTSQDGNIVRPTFVINSGNPVEFSNGVLHLLHILGASQEEINAARDKLYNNAFGHHTEKVPKITSGDEIPKILSYKSIPVEHYFQKAQVTEILKRYQDDFMMFHLEKNVSLVQYVAW